MALAEIDAATTASVDRGCRLDLQCEVNADLAEKK
jgi:hypothetical protein